jgi:type II secretory pathway pseudopilin PulG
MKIRQFIRPSKASRQGLNRGFALVVTLLMMILLSILALGMLSLSSVSLRTSGRSSAETEAKANARLALMLAIGKLQQYAGPDMRVTAPADTLDDSYPPALGVWRSWEGSNNDPNATLKGRPIAPDYSSKTKSVSDDGRFVTWLVSGADENPSPADVATLIQKTPSGGTVPLLAAGTLTGTDLRQVHCTPQKVGTNGAIAWWISGENQKARIPKPYDDNNLTLAQWADRNRNHAVADPEPFSLDPVLADPSLASKAVTRSSADLIANGAVDAITPTQSFHDLSSNSMGLLTNVATGGWRKDLSLLTEKWDEQPTSGLEFFQISPTERLEYTRPATSTDYQPANSMLYHWSDYRASTLREFWARRGPIASWAKIKSYATLYKKMSATSSRAPNINHQSWQDNGSGENAHETFHNIRLLPQMARLQIVVSHYATTAGAAPGKYRPAVLYTPIVTVWNPYNTRLTLNGTLKFSPAYTWPLALNHSISGANLADEYWAVQHGGTSGEYRDKRLGKSTSWFADMVFTLAQNPMILEPGETRIFSPSEDYLRDETSTSRVSINLNPGVRTGVGFYYSMDRRFDLNTPADPQKISFDGGAQIEADAKFDVASRGTACGWAYQWFIDSFGSGRSHSWFQIFYEHDVADALYPPKEGLASATLAQCADTPVPFLSMTLGSRIANHRATATKGLVQANPVVDFFSSGPRPRFTDTYPGMDNLLNCPWDFSVVEHSSGGDDMLPNVDNDTNSSYIVTGVRKAEGISRIVAAELPTRPLASLADLTHMQIRGLNPTPPYAGNVVANSDASPLIPKDGIVNTSGNSRANTRSNEQQDDSYCANQVLFDDWFFSSIAPDPDGFGSSAGADLRQNYLDFLTGEDPLVNRSYLPILEDQVTDATKADEIYTDEVQPTDSWKTIASRLEVRGMFNVNSTSVKAWRALLGHARNHKIPYTQTDGSIALSEDTDYAFSRTSVAGDRAAGDAPQVAGEYADTTEFTGYRVFTDERLDLLAEKIVEQVRLRGPFLSLSEFVNRQLSSDYNLALGGAIQTALNALTADSLNPFETIQNESVPSKANPFVADPNAALPDTGYVFPEAAVGHNTYGLPGWTRQADVLRPLAPILAARDDTFTIRAYGESRDADGTVRARAWCEATVQRKRDFLDPADEPDITTAPTEPTNQTYGRRFKVISFRWLNADEV